MAEQLGFGFGGAEPRTDRLFFGVFPDPNTAELIARQARLLRAERGLRGRPLLTHRFHVTLFEIGVFAGLPRDVVSQSEAAAMEVSRDPFEMMFDRAVGYRDSSAYVLQGTKGVEELRAFRDRLGAAMSMKPRLSKISQSPFRPHLTLLYDSQTVPEHPILPIRWTVREFVLVHSLIGQTKHIPLGRWALER